MARQPNRGAVPLPEGFEQLPDLGPDVVGTRPRRAWAIAVWVSAALLAAIAVLLGVSLVAQQFSIGGAVTVAVFLVAGGAMAWLATSMNKPILTIDDESVRTHAAFGKGSIQLRSITDVRFGPGKRSLIVDADGGIITGGTPSNRPWVAIANIQTYQVSATALRDYIAERARRARRR